MRRRPRQSVRWRRIALVLALGLTAVYGWSARREFPHGGSPAGLALGILAAALVVLLLFYGVRKRRYRSRLGTMEGWLQAHIYLGLLALVAAIYHTGFNFQDRMAVATLAVLAAVVASGVAGAGLYAVVPRLMTDVESNLTAGEISDRLNQLADSMARLAAGRSGPFRRIFELVLAESLPKPLAGWRVLFGRGSTRKAVRRGGAAAAAGAADRGWETLLGRVEAGERDDLERLLVLSRQHKELHQRLVAQQRYKNLLEGWLYLHLPLSIALVVLLAAHIAAALYFAPLVSR